MSVFFYVFSNGRCATQFLARQLSKVADRERVVHELHSEAMASRIVFRDPNALYPQLGRMPDLQRYFASVEYFIRNDVRCVNCGWPGYAWVDYLNERFQDAFNFVHLVRNPYDNAASHVTHHKMLPGRLSEVERLCKIFGTDPKVRHTDLVDGYDGFNSFERQLFHWLEVTTYLAEHDADPGFRGLYRFEDITAPDGNALSGLLSVVLGRTVDAPEGNPFDRVHAFNVQPTEFRVDPRLRDAVDTLAIRLGYSPEELDASRNAERLHATYSRKRFDQPCNPRIRVTVPK